MSKYQALFFSSMAIVFMSAMAISISHSGWLTMLFGVLTLASIASGFIFKAKKRREKMGTKREV